MKKNLYKFAHDFGRIGDLSDMFVATPEEAAALVGKELYFGSALEGQNELTHVVESADITLKTDNQAFLEEAERLGIDLNGEFNPLNYCLCEKCGLDKNVLTGRCRFCDGVEQS